jgi:hypothetical protein
MADVSARWLRLSGIVCALDAGHPLRELHRQRTGLFVLDPPQRIAQAADDILDELEAAAIEHGLLTIGDPA